MRAIVIGWALLRLLWPRTPIYIDEPPAPAVTVFTPSIVIHVHLTNDRR